MSQLILPIVYDEKSQPVVSTLAFAEGLGIQHASLIKTIRDYQSAIEANFGRVRFEIDADYQNVTGIERASHALLTEDQSLFVGSLSRNSERVVEFKSVLVRSFAEARKQLASLSAPSYQVEDPIARAERWIAEQREKQALASENAVLKPKADYADAVLLSETELTTTVIASQLNMSAIALNKKLHTLGIQWKRSGTWVLYAKYFDKNYAHMRTHPYQDSQGKAHTSHYLVWTETGRQFIHSLLNPALSQPKGLLSANA